MSSNRPSTPASGSAEDLLAQRPAALHQTGRVAVAPRGKPSVTTILAGVVGAAVLFAGGLLVGHATGSSSTTASAAAAAQGRAGGFAGAGGFTAGQIASIDGSTLTVTKSDGTTVTVTTSPSTTVSQTAQADVSALTVGESVTVIGQTGSDSSVTAQSITEGTAGFGGPGAGAQG
jgi:hypothetical protein